MNFIILDLSIIISGLIIGSFINVLAYRTPRGISVTLSRSICPKCNINIPLYRNIPIITYIIQQGKCHNCNKSISFQYPLIEFITACIFYFGFKNNLLLNEYILFIWVSSILLAISIIDFKTLTIPLKLIIALLLGELVFMVSNIDSIYNMMLGLFLGLGYLGITFLITSLIYKKQTLGYGDLLLISLIGLWIGPINILICIFLSSAFGILVWFFKASNEVSDYKLPFGTYLSINGIILKILNIDFISYMNNL